MWQLRICIDVTTSMWIYFNIFDVSDLGMTTLCALKTICTFIVNQFLFKIEIMSLLVDLNQNVEKHVEILWPLRILNEADAEPNGMWVYEYLSQEVANVGYYDPSEIFTILLIYAKIYFCNPKLRILNHIFWLFLLSILMGRDN